MNNCEHNVKRCVVNVPLFKSLNDEEQDEVLNIATHRNYEKGDLIYMSGDMSDKLFVIHQGKIKISRINEEGKEQVIRILESGEFMGELTLFQQLPASDYAEALESTTICLLDGKNFRKLIIKYPLIAIKLLETLSSRLEKMESLLENINLLPVDKRLAQTLIKLANEINEIELASTKGVLASQLGMSQATLSRQLTLFEQKGIIKQIGQRKIIINRKKLENI